MNKKLYTLFISLITLTTVANAQLSAEFKADTTLICEGVTVYFQDLSTFDTTITDWLWEFGDGSTSTLNNPSHTYAITGKYNVKLTVQDINNVANYEYKTDYIKVRIQPDAGFIFNSANDVFYTDTFNLSSFIYEFNSISTLYDTLDYYYYWDFGDGTFVDSSSSLIYKFQEENDYSIRFVVSAGFACTDSAEGNITIEDITLVPNVFTPNGDGINDVLTIKTNGVQSYDLMIFSRWGTIVHTVNAKKIAWDGHTSYGTLVEEGVYYYHLSCTDNGYTETGFIHVIR